MFLDLRHPGPLTIGEHRAAASGRPCADHGLLLRRELGCPLGGGDLRVAGGRRRSRAHILSLYDPTGFAAHTVEHGGGADEHISGLQFRLLGHSQIISASEEICGRLRRSVVTGRDQHQSSVLARRCKSEEYPHPPTLSSTAVVGVAQAPGIFGWANRQRNDRSFRTVSDQCRWLVHYEARPTQCLQVAGQYRVLLQRLKGSAVGRRPLEQARISTDGVDGLVASRYFGG